MWAFLPGYILIVLTIVFVELTTFRSSHSSSTIAAWSIIYFSLDAAMCMLATLGVTNNLKVPAFVRIPLLVLQPTKLPMVS